LFVTFAKFLVRWIVQGCRIIVHGDKASALFPRAGKLETATMDRHSDFMDLPNHTGSTGQTEIASFPRGDHRQFVKHS